jgi:stress-induced morphogen
MRHFSNLSNCYNRLYFSFYCLRAHNRNLGQYSKGMSDIEQRIRNKLQNAFAPVYFEVVNESYKHNVPRGSETHFKVTIVSNKFENVPLLEQHRMVNSVLQEELLNGVHALAIKTIPASKWQNEPVEFTTPKCLGGGKHQQNQTTAPTPQHQP